MKSVAFALTIATVATTFVLLLTTGKSCASGSKCGDCYYNGVAGKPVWDNGSQSCKICED